MTAYRLFVLCKVHLLEFQDEKMSDSTGLSSTMFRFDKDRRVRIYKVKVFLDSLLQCLDLIMTEG